MNNRHLKLIIFGFFIFMAFMIGSYILVATFFGLITLAGMIALIESIPFLKWIVKKSTSLIDIIFFVFTIIAVMSYGLNISAALTVAGFGYTMVYAPYVRKEKEDKKKNKVVRYMDDCNRM